MAKTFEMKVTRPFTDAETGELKNIGDIVTTSSETRIYRMLDLNLATLHAIHPDKKKKGKKVLLAAADVYRPAAIDQLEVLAETVDVPVYTDRTTQNVPMLAMNALQEARSTGADYLIIDTAGRLEIDESMVRELVQVKQMTGAGE